MKYLFRNDYSFGAHPKVLSALAETSLEGNVGYGDDAYCDRAKASSGISASVPRPRSSPHRRHPDQLYCHRRLPAPLGGRGGGRLLPYQRARGRRGGSHRAKILQVCTGADGKIRPEQIEPSWSGTGTNTWSSPGWWRSPTPRKAAWYTPKRNSPLFRNSAGSTISCSSWTAPVWAALWPRGQRPHIGRSGPADRCLLHWRTKNGALMGEALVISNPALQGDFFRIKKQLGAVLAKGWLLGVQFEALLKDGLYFEMARHANAMAARLQSGLKAKGWKLWVDSPTNQVFPIVPDSLKPQIDAVCHYGGLVPRRRARIYHHPVRDLLQHREVGRRRPVGRPAHPVRSPPMNAMYYLKIKIPNTIYRIAQFSGDPG